MADAKSSLRGNVQRPTLGNELPRSELRRSE